MSDSDSDSDDYLVEQPSLALDDPMRSFLPASFGQKTKEANIAAQIEQTRRQVPKPAEPKTTRPPPNSDSDDDSEDDSDSSEDETERFPV